MLSASSISHITAVYVIMSYMMGDGKRKMRKEWRQDAKEER
jgi:hypothetical protein